MNGVTKIEYSAKQLDLIRRTVAADCTVTEFDLSCEAARRVGLDPFRKQIYAVVYSKDKPEKRKMAIITGIDGYRAIASRCKDYRPDNDAPILEIDPSLKSETNPAGIISATVKCWKLGPDGQWYQVAGTANWDEFCPMTEKWEYSQEAGKRVPTGIFELDKRSNWYRMPKLMIAKVAEAQALRRGWPEDLSGLYTNDEMERAGVEMTASEAVDNYEKEQRLISTGGKDAIFVSWFPSDPIQPVPIGQFADKAAAFIRGCNTIPDLVGWEETNRAALKDFWAKSKTDALELKKVLEARRAEIIRNNNV